MLMIDEVLADKAQTTKQKYNWKVKNNTPGQQERDNFFFKVLMNLTTTAILTFLLVKRGPKREAIDPETTE